MTTKNTTEEVIEIVEAMPGVTAREIYELCPHRKESSLSSTLFNLKNRGILKTSSKTLPTKIGPREFTTYFINTDPNPVPPAPRRKQKQPTDAGYKAQIEELKDKIAELEAWKQAAMSRFPDLAVSPIVLKARRLVADEVRAGGDTLLANQIIEGRKDDTMLVKVTIKALEEAVDE